MRDGVPLARQHLGNLLHRRADEVALFEEIASVIGLVDADRHAATLCPDLEEDVILGKELVERDDVWMPQRLDFVG